MIKRRYLTFLALLITTHAVTAATPEEELKRLEQLLAVPEWNLTATLGGGAGYRDNVLLSPTRPQASGFARANVETMLLRAPAGGFDGYAFFSLEESRYFSTEATDHERAVFLLAEARWQPVPSWKFGLPAQAYHVDQVVDVSVTEAEFNTAVLKVTGFGVGPTVRWNFATPWWLEAKGAGRKDHFEGGVDGYLEGEGSLRIGRDWKYGTMLSITGASRRRNHDSRLQYTLGGRPLDGTRLQFRQNEVSAHLEWVADEKKSWRARLTATIQQNRDNGSGYFDFDERRLVMGLGWRSDSWEVELSAGVASFEFPRQLVGIGIAPKNRHKDDYQASITLTRRLTASLSLKSSYEWEKAVSNDDRSRFRTNTGYLGLQWSWDNLGSAGL